MRIFDTYSGIVQIRDKRMPKIIAADVIRELRLLSDAIKHSAEAHLRYPFGSVCGSEQVRISGIQSADELHEELSIFRHQVHHSDSSVFCRFLPGRVSDPFHCVIDDQLITVKTEVLWSEAECFFRPQTVIPKQSDVHFLPDGKLCLRDRNELRRA